MSDESVAGTRLGSSQRAPWRWGSRELLRLGLIALIVLLGARAFMQPYAVEGVSMNPGLRDGERLFVSRAIYLHLDTTRLWNLLPGIERDGSNVVFPFDAPAPGDVIVFEAPAPSDEPYIKRVVGLPGERVSVRGGQVFVDGAPLAEPYLAGPGDVPTECAGQWCDVTVPPNSVYLLGDNRLPHQSVDSRAFGPIGYEQIIGQAFFSTWPLDTLGPVPGA